MSASQASRAVASCPSRGSRRRRGSAAAGRTPTAAAARAAACPSSAVPGGAARGARGVRGPGAGGRRGSAAARRSASTRPPCPATASSRDPLIRRAPPPAVPVRPTPLAPARATGAAAPEAQGAGKPARRESGVEASPFAARPGASPGRGGDPGAKFIGRAASEPPRPGTFSPQRISRSGAPSRARAPLESGDRTRVRSTPETPARGTPPRYEAGPRDGTTSADPGVTAGPCLDTGIPDSATRAGLPHSSAPPALPWDRSVTDLLGQGTTGEGSGLVPLRSEGRCPRLIGASGEGRTQTHSFSGPASDPPYLVSQT